jgi:hypothetical protein
MALTTAEVNEPIRELQSANGCVWDCTLHMYMEWDDWEGKFMRGGGMREGSAVMKKEKCSHKKGFFRKSKSHVDFKRN